MKAMGISVRAVELGVQALHDIGYHGCVSAEVLPLPDPESAARQTMMTYQKLFRPK